MGQAQSKGMAQSGAARSSPAKANTANQQRVSNARPKSGSTIVKKSWPAQSSLQTKSLTRNNIQESFNRNVLITGNQGSVGPSGLADVSIRTISKNVTNVRTAWDSGATANENGVWTNQRQNQQQGQPRPRGQNWSGSDRGVVRGSSSSSSSEVPVYSVSGQPVLSRHYVGGPDGMNRGTNGGSGVSFDRSRNGVRVESAWNPYGISGVSGTSAAGGVYEGESVSNNNNYSGNGSYKKNRVYANGVGPSVNTRGPNSTFPGHFNHNNNNTKFRESVHRSNISYQEAGGGVSVTTTSSSAAVAAGSGAIVTDFWSNYGYKFALVTAAGLIGFLAFLGVVRCLRSSSGAESGVIATATGRGGSSSGGGNSSNSNGEGSRGIRSAGLALSTSLLPSAAVEEDSTPLNNAGSPYFVPMLSVQSPGYAGMERLGVPARSTSSSSASSSVSQSATSSSQPMVGLHHHHHHHHHHTLAVQQQQQHGDDDDDRSSSISRNGSASRRTRMGPSQRDYSRSGEVPRNGNCNSVAMESSGGSTVDMKMYVALESSSSSGATSATSASSHYNNNPGYNHNNNNYHHSKGCHPETARLGMNPSGRCPYHVRLGDGEWGSADRPANNHTTAQYETEMTRTYVKPPPNKTALDVPDRDNSAVGGGGAAAAAAMPSRNSSSNLLNFPYVHGMSASQEALSSSSLSSGAAASGGRGTAGGAAVDPSGGSKSSSKQSNFPFSRFFKSRGSNTSINHHTSSNGHSAKSRPESPCRYAAVAAAAPVCGGPVSSSASKSIAGSVDVLTSSSSTNYCVYVTADASAASSYRSMTTTTTTTQTTTQKPPQQHLPCDMTTSNREMDLNSNNHCCSSSSASLAMAAGTTASSYSSIGTTAQATAGSANRLNNNNSSNCSNLNRNHLNHNSHHSKGGSISYGGGGGAGHAAGGGGAVHSINSYHQTTGPQLPTAANLPMAQQQQEPHPSVSGGGGAAAGSSCGGGVGPVATKSASSTTMASCDKRVYVEKRIKTSDSESTDSSTCEGGGGRQSAGFKGGMDTDQSV